MDKQKKRLGIFAYYDADGQVDDYIFYLLSHIKAFCTKQIVVVNGTLEQTAAKKLEDYADEVLFRENQGYDITAYCHGLFSQNYREYDEVLFYNQTIFGPVTPLEPLFEKMQQKEVDFWGLTKHKGAQKAPWDENTAILPHIQSFFFVVGSRMLQSDAFHDYWKNLPKIETYWDAVSKHEVLFTHYFEQLGYSWDVAIETQELDVYNDYPLMGMPELLVSKKACPFIKRKSFQMPRNQFLSTPQGESAHQLYQYLKEYTDYPISLIVQNLLRTEPLSYFTQAIGNLCLVQGQSKATKEVSAIGLLYFAHKDMVRAFLSHQKKISKQIQWVIVYQTQELQEEFSSQIDFLHESRVDARPAGLLFMEYLPQWKEKYEYCFFLNTEFPLLLTEFVDITSLQIALDSMDVPTMVEYLEKNQEVGMLMPLAPSHQEAFTLTIRTQQEVERIQEQFKVPFTNLAMGFRGGVFFAKTKALENQISLHQTDFEGTYPIWEIVPPLLAQKNGFLTTYVATQNQLQTQFFNRDFVLQQMQLLWKTPHKARMDQIQFRMEMILKFYYERRYHMTLEQAFEAKLTLKQKIWICLQIFLKPKTFQKWFGSSKSKKPELFDALD